MSGHDSYCPVNRDPTTACICGQRERNGLWGEKVADITAPKYLEIVIREDSKVVWINVDGVCVFRACKIGRLLVDDRRRD